MYVDFLDALAVAGIYQGNSEIKKGGALSSSEA
jgi:hypothetical protein